jgi:N utilization substance protein A
MVNKEKMKKEMFLLIDQLGREKGIPEDVLLEAIESALLSAARKKYADKNVAMRLDPKAGTIELFESKSVVEEVTSEIEEISLEDAKEIDPEAEDGDVIETPLDFKGFGRIAAQTAKQVIFQRVREAERDVIYKEFKDKVGQVVSGTVMRKEKNVYFINIGKTEAALPQRNALPGENLKRGDLIRAYIEDIDPTSKGPMIHLSRSDSRLVSALFSMEVPEISEGLVVIKQVVREPGERTKLAVYSTNPSIDPVGACVGMKGTRVQSIVRELRGERIDIIPWTDDLRMLIARALSPASIERVGIVEDEKTAMVVVSDQQLSIAIGRKGQNVRLAMKLTGWDIDILSETEYSKIKMEEAETAFGETIKEPVEEPSVEEPSVEEPSVEEPSVEEPSVEESSVEEPSVEESSVEEG